MSEPAEKKATTKKVSKPYRGIQLFPIWKVLTQYNNQKFNSDIRAGLNVALLAFPQGMAYAMIAGLPIQYGIFGSAIATIVGPIFAGSRFVMMGPTNATSVLLLSTFLALGVPDHQKLVILPLILFLVAVFQIIGSYLNAASIIQYISKSVIVGYITAAAILIMANQLQHTLGFRISGASTFINVIQKTVEKLPSTHFPTLLLSLLTAATFILLKRFFKSLPNVGITLILMSLVGFGMHEFGWDVQKLQAVS
ncbi:MAG: SulP family inorganic anion transporter, partial [Opitutaceae bacterium]|nr:SulP family inorganic anion transporter [Opitutaceae bacterium]